jgi:hypothetical protein
MKFFLDEKLHKIEIAFESRALSKSQDAQILIKRIAISGTDMGGALECKACDAGSIANTRIYMCRKCSPGTQPNPSQSDCVFCAGNTFNPNVGDKCLECPAFTKQS